MKMKRTVCMLLCVLLCIGVLMPITAYAKTYNLSGTDMSVSLDDTIWYVFIRDNIADNPELEELGLTYEMMQEVFYDNEAYMDALLCYDTGDFVELIVRKRSLNSDIANLSNYSEGEVMILVEELAQLQGAEEYSVYENRHKYGRLEYVDYDYEYYICEYVTIINKDNYTLTFQSSAPYIDWEYEEIQCIVDSVNFAIDPTIKEKEPDSFVNNVIILTLGGAVVGAIIGIVIAVSAKKKNKQQRADARYGGGDWQNYR